MAAPNVVIKGVKDVIHGLDVFHAKVDNALRKTLMEAAEDIHRAVKAIAPVDTGKYKKSIHWTIARSGLIAWVYASRKSKGVIRGSRYDTNKSLAVDMSYVRKRKRKRKTKLAKNGYIGHLLEYGTMYKGRVHSKPIPHWTPARNYMRIKFGPMLEIAIKSVKMYHTKTDTPRLKFGNFGSNTWVTSTTPPRVTGKYFSRVGNYGAKA